MSTACNFPAPSGRLAGQAHIAASDPADGDDGIHIATVTHIDCPDGSVLRVVVSWFEGGRWVERTVELPDQ